MAIFLDLIFLQKPSTALYLSPNIFLTQYSYFFGLSTYNFYTFNVKNTAALLILYITISVSFSLGLGIRIQKNKQLGRFAFDSLSNFYVSIFLVLSSLILVSSIIDIVFSNWFETFDFIAENVIIYILLIEMTAFLILISKSNTKRIALVKTLRFFFNFIISLVILLFLFLIFELFTHPYAVPTRYPTTLVIF